MMPELFLADALGAVGKPLLRVHTAGSVGGSTGDRRGQPGAGRRARARAGGGLGEAVGVERHVGAVDPDAVQHAGQRRRRRLLRPARALLHPPLRRARPHRRDGGGQGPAQRREEPVRAPAPARHHARVGAGVADAVGPDPLRRDLPVLGRRVRGGDRQRAGRARPSDRPAWIHATAMRSEPTTYAGRDQVNPQAGRDAAAALWKQAGITNPLERDRRRRDLRAVLLVRADVAGEPGFMPEGDGLEADRGRRDRASAASCRSTPPAACSAPTRSAPRACCASPRRRCR